MRKAIFTLLILCGLFLHTHAVYFKHLGKQDGLSQLSVMAIHQDKLGRMWFGTEEGLNVYDGVKVVAYKPDHTTDDNDAFIGNMTSFVTGDKAGDIFFNSDNSLIRYIVEKDEFRRIRKGSVRAVCSSDNKVWTGITDTIYSWNPETEILDYRCKLPRKDLYTTYIWQDYRQRCWVGTSKGLFVTEGDSMICVIPDEDVYAIFEDSKYNLWVSIRMTGMYKIDRLGEITHFMHDPLNPNSLSDNQVRGFAEDNYGNIWIGTFSGLNKYNPNNNQFSVLKNSPLPGSLSHNSVFPVFKDKQGSIWLGTYYGGVNYFNPETDLFTIYTANQSRNDCVNYPFVGKMVEDADQNLWICTEGGGLNFFDRRTKTFTYLTKKEGVQSLAHNNLKAIAYSKKYNKLYIGTHTGGLSIYDLQTKTFRNPYFTDPEYRNIASDRITHIQIYGDDLIATGQNGIFKMNMETEKVSSLFKNKSYPGSGCFFIDSNHYLWLPSGKRLNRINLKDETETYSYVSGQKGLGMMPISSITEDHRGQIFLGTTGSGLYCFNEEDESFTGYNTGNSLISSDYCYELKLSGMNKLMITGDKGLCVFDTESEQFQLIELGDILPLAGINKGCGLYICSNGEVFVGGTNGFATFFEQDLQTPLKSYNLYFSDLYINNERITPLGHHDILSEAIPFTNTIHLNHDQNNLRFNFTSNNYINSLRKLPYEYKLEGFNDYWIDCTDNQISYTNLNPGKYRLIVREKLSAQTNDIPQTISMSILISPAWYATHLAYICYVLLLGSILYGYFRFKKSQYRLETSLAIERKEKESIEELNQAKLQFFSNVSHEFKTPLTLIISQVELLLQSCSLSPMVYNKLLKVYKNAFHMRGLISELLDFRKLEEGHLSLRVFEQDIVPFLKEIFQSFSDYASNRSVIYKFNCNAEEIDCWFDPKQMQKVFFNLLSNAFKYSKPHATIEMIVEDSEDEVIIKVIDNGIGIAQEDINKIFDHFYQIENGLHLKSDMPSSGIGLALTKNIIELHHGTIVVKSTIGYGSIFTVRLKKTGDHFTAEERIETPAQLSVIDQLPETFIQKEKSEESSLSTSIEEEEDMEGVRKVLIVEDNPELLDILVSLFSPTYDVITAINGKEGLQKARESQPDLIVSDVMMPEMSGTDMCMRIKHDFEICHIPVLLLTALSSAEHSIEGFKRGADDYVSKPFNAKVLLTRCNNLIRNRIILQNKFSQEKEFDAQALANNPLDQKFLDNINRIIEENMDNQEFDMNKLAAELGLSRSSLYSKFKALTGITPNDYVLQSKLKRAAFLLTEHPELQIADISDRLGFGSPRYFTRCFKAQFEITPADYRKAKSRE